MSQNGLDIDRSQLVIPISKLVSWRENEYKALNNQGISSISIARYSIEFIKGIPYSAIESFIHKDVFENLGPYICEDPDLVTMCVKAASELSADIAAYVHDNYLVHRVDSIEFEIVHGNSIIVSYPNES